MMPFLINPLSKKPHYSRGSECCHTKTDIQHCVILRVRSRVRFQRELIKFDPVLHAIIVAINIEMAMLTPPVGLELFEPALSLYRRNFVVR
jgi:hypothetical protein